MKKYVVRRENPNRYLVTGADRGRFSGPWGSNDINEATKYNSHHEAIVNLFEIYDGSTFKVESGIEIVPVREVQKPQWEVVE